MPTDHSDLYRERWVADDVERFIHQLCPNEMCRDIAARRVSNTIRSAHSMNSGLWGLSHLGHYIRFNFGNMEAVIWEPETLCLMVDVPALRTTRAHEALEPYLQGLGGHYSTAPDSAYVSLPTDNPRALARLVELSSGAHTRHLEVASRSQINGQTRKSHHPGLVDALGRLVGDVLPQPAYVTIERPQAAASSKLDASGQSDDSDPFDDVNSAAGELATASDTERKALVRARVGQGPFRRDLEKLWSTCAVTGIRSRAALRASHIKPWRVSNNGERLDPFNGLLLVANLDALFDAGLISFSDSGDLLCSWHLPAAERPRLGISPQMRLRIVDHRHKAYLEYHRARVFKA